MLRQVLFALTTLAAVAMGRSDVSYTTSPYPCVFHTPDGSYYDLRDLMRSSTTTDGYNNEDFISSDAQGNVYELNFCAPSLARGCEGKNTPICQTTPPGHSFSLGDLATETFSQIGDNVGVRLEYFNGDSCRYGDRQTTVNIYCNETALGSNIYVDAYEADTCEYQIEIQSWYGCASSLVDSSCLIESNGYTFNLSPLTGQDYSGTDTTGNTYYVAFCGNTQSVAATPASPVVQRSGTSVYSLGTLDSADALAFDDGTGVTVFYTDGQTCRNGTPRSVKIDIQCDQNQSGFKINRVTELDTCVYYIRGTSKYGCHQ